MITNTHGIVTISISQAHNDEHRTLSVGVMQIQGERHPAFAEFLTKESVRACRALSRAKESIPRIGERY